MELNHMDSVILGLGKGFSLTGMSCCFRRWQRQIDRSIRKSSSDWSLHGKASSLKIAGYNPFFLQSAAFDSGSV